MKVNAINPTQSANFTAKKIENNKKENKIPKNSKKVLYTLAGLATIAASGVGASYAAKHLKKSINK